MSSVRNFSLAGTKAVLRNNASLDTSTYKFGTASIKFDGNVNSYVRSNEKFTVTNSDWCLEFWVNLSAQQPNNPITLAQLSTDLPDQYGPGHLSLTVNSGLKLVVYDYNEATPLISTSENLLGAGWKHVAVSREQSSWRLFVDGVEIGNATWSGSVIGTNAWFIGGHPFSQTGINGWVDDVRFTFNKPRYVSTFTPPTAQVPTSGLTLTTNDEFISNVVLLLPFDTTFDDVTVTTDFPVATGSVAITSAQYKYGTGSAVFDGASYLSYTVDGGLGPSDFTLEFWIYKTANSGWIFNSRTNGISSDGIDIRHDLYTTTANLVIFNATTLALNTWHHVAIVRQGTTLTRYINGVADGSNTSNSNFNGSSFKIGGNPTENVGYLTGYFDDFRLTVGVARYTSSFTPPNQLSFPLTTDQFFNNVSLRLTFDGNSGGTSFTDSSNNTLTPTVVGNTNLNTTTVKYGSASGYFDGDGDYLSYAANANLAMGSGAFTMEAWVYPTSLPVQGGIFGQTADNSGGTVGYGVDIRIAPSGIIAYISFHNATAWSAGPVAVAINQWHHVAVNRAADGTTKLFVNGIGYGTAVNSTNCTESRLLIGSLLLDNPARSGFTFAGYIDDVRITKGVARYSTDFAPPSGPLPTSAGASDPDFNNVSLLLHFNGTNGSTTFTDSSPIVNTVSASGSPIISTTQFKFGDSALYLDGSGSHVTVPHSSNFEFGSAPWTVECWIYPTRAATNGSGIITTRNGQNTSLDGAWDLFLTSQYAIRFAVKWTFVTIYSANNAITVNQWTHLAVSRVANTYTLYINGVASGNYTDSTNTTVPTTVSAPVRIGTMMYGSYAGPESQAYPFFGYIDEVRITKGLARYTANFTPPTTAFPDTSTADRDILFNDVKLLLTANNYFDYPANNINVLPSRLATFTPDWPVKVKAPQRQINLNREYFGGKGRVYGTTKIKGVPNLPVSRRVRLFTEKEGILVSEVWSDPVTGEYEFLGVDPNQRFTVVTYDYQQNFRAVVADNLTPEAYNP